MSFICDITASLSMCYKLFGGSFIQNKVSSVVFKCGSCGDDMVIARKVDLESRFTGWLHAVLLGESLLSSFAST